ncbi:metalloendopeptidase [Desmophyllum pertusum]|uniref:Metalloendopeptidase n=1 Tax=Desmophyllum pertusum TaxID=174260 RepID=A0A9W9YBN9_9CNID|nr:metalloendopeptidase [Desmophyllum pertusum]
MKLPTSSVICILIYLSSLIHNGENHAINGKPLHHLMTREELKHFFGADHLSNVPEYDVALPFEANEEGSFVTYSLNHRLKRSLAEGNNDDTTTTYHYKIHALGEQLHLHVKRNTNFMVPGLQLETRDEKGRKITKPVSRKAYVIGKVDSDPSSLVALSVSDGLTGIVKRSNETRSSQEDIECHTKTDKITLAKRDLSPLETTSHLQEDSSDSGIIDKYLEVALLADQQIVAVHGDKTEDFLLLIASIVDKIFHDTTSGAIKINFVVTRLVLISNEELGIDPSDSGIAHIAVKGKVSAWARNNNKADESDPLQFDVAHLIRSGGTRGGIAASGGICRSKDVASVVRENGLQTAYLVAHEIAHNLGVGHDSVEKGCPNGVNIMSKVAQGGPGSVEWSTCSRDTIQNFLMSKVSVCLDDPPPSTRPKPPAAFYTELPGELADADTQCQHQYGTGYRRCPQRESNCASLFCTQDGYNCNTRISRPLDGTACGLRHWCIKGACVDNGSPMVHGGWGEWSNYTACTPACEGGVRYRERTCTNPPVQNGGDNCAGPSKAWEICNSDVICNTSEPSFRDQQCKQINSDYTAYYRPGANPCSLVCKTGRSSAKPFGNVVDGTRCKSDRYEYDVCIEGKCQPVGCDHILKSGKQKDRCGICDGNGDLCNLVKSSFTTDKTGNYRAYTIVDLPANSSHAVFQQRNVLQYNVIGVQDENGNYLIKVPTWGGKDIYYAGTKISYKNDNQNPDRLLIEGPTTKVLRIVYVRLQGPNVGVDYEYYIPLESNATPVPTTCHWSTSDWTDCSTGQQTREVYCERSDDLTPASENCCGEKAKPNAIKLCFGWHVTVEPCTKTCGKGSQSRSVVCRAKLNDTHYKIESDSLCDGTPKPIIIEHQYCNEVQCPASWTAQSECSTVCLPGERNKYVKCSRSNEQGENEDISDIQCGYEPKPITEPCNEDNPCKELAIGCFKTPDGLFSEMLGDFTSYDPDSAIMECGERTHEKGYHVFALGYGGLCMSGPYAQDNYYKHGQPKTSRERITTNCSNGIGLGPKQCGLFVW